MNEVVEKVATPEVAEILAAAIFERDYAPPGWTWQDALNNPDHVDGFNWVEGCRTDAMFAVNLLAPLFLRSLLDAVSEPSEAMVADGWLAAHRIMTQDRCNHEMLRAAFRAMIAALRLEVEGLSGLPDKAEWIAAYVKRARAVGFQCAPTEDGCIYGAEYDSPELRMIAKPCDCGCKSWGMFEK